MNESFTLYDFMKSLTIPDIATILLSLIIGLICLGGIIFALIRLKRHKFTSIVTTIALLLMAISSITLPILIIYSTESGNKKIAIEREKSVDAAEEELRKFLSENNIRPDNPRLASWYDLKNAYEYRERKMGVNYKLSTLYI